MLDSERLVELDILVLMGMNAFVACSEGFVDDIVLFCEVCVVCDAM
jgi:hypothetical protein